LCGASSREGFAQYFAALYAEKYRGDAFGGMIRQFRRWALDESDQGPIYLGYRLGHIKGESRVFRALVYNKAAGVLHMLRRLIGDDAFFAGLRRFYATWRFQKAGTDDLRQAFEVESHRSLERFFERWIYGSDLPHLRFSHRTEGADLVLRFDQTGEVFDVPVLVTLEYADGKRTDIVVPVTDRASEMRVPLSGTLRGVLVNRDEAAIAEIER
jgi:aminopeptidase N